MRKAGFIDMSPEQVIDEKGAPCDIINLTLDGRRYAIRKSELSSAIRTNVQARVEVLTQNWKIMFAGVIGLACISKSGKAINISMTDGQKYTIGLEGLIDVISGRTRYTSVVKIPDYAITIEGRVRRIGVGQQQFSQPVTA